MPSVGETGWGQLVNQNFAILDGVSNVTSITTTFTSLDTAIVPITAFDQFVMISDTAMQYAYIYSSAATVPTGFTIKPSKSLRYLIFYIDGNFTMNGTIDTLPVTLTTEIPPTTQSENTTVVLKQGILCNSLQTLITKTNGNVTMNIQEPYEGAYVDFNTRRTGILGDTAVTIPHAIAAGGKYVVQTTGNNGISGTASNTCNGGGGSAGGNVGPLDNPITITRNGGTGCIYGQYSGPYGYGDNGIYNKYRCAIILIIKGNITLNGNIIQRGGHASENSNPLYGGYGGGGPIKYPGGGGGGGGAPVFIYYTGAYTNNGTINTDGGTGGINTQNGITNIGGNGGAGGIKVTKISL